MLNGQKIVTLKLEVVFIRQITLLLLINILIYCAYFLMRRGVDFLLVGVIVGIFSTLILLLIQWLYLKKAGLSTSGIKVIHTIVFEVTGSKEQVFEICLESINDIKKSSIGLLNKKKGVFTVNVGASIRTWGDEIHFEIKDIGNNQCKVEVTSRPALRTTVIDYGKNKENIMKIQNHLSSKIEIKNLHHL